MKSGRFRFPNLVEGEVLCRIHAIAICGTDPEIINGSHQKKGWPPSFPFTLGHEWSGEVVKLGPGVKGFKVGDRIAGEAHRGCGSCANCMKGNYTLCLNYGDASTGHRHSASPTPAPIASQRLFHQGAAQIPDGLSYRHAALLDTAGVALHGIEMIGVTPGGAAAVWGPGPIGLISLQMMKAMGAKTLIVVGRRHRLGSPANWGPPTSSITSNATPSRRFARSPAALGWTRSRNAPGRTWRLASASPRCARAAGST